MYGPNRRGRQCKTTCEHRTVWTQMRINKMRKLSFLSVPSIARIPENTRRNTWIMEIYILIQPDNSYLMQIIEHFSVMAPKNWSTRRENCTLPSGCRIIANLWFLRCHTLVYKRLRKKNALWSIKMVVAAAEWGPCARVKARTETRPFSCKCESNEKKQQKCEKAQAHTHTQHEWWELRQISNHHISWLTSSTIYFILSYFIRADCIVRGTRVTDTCLR